MVECQLPKLKVAGSNPVSRSKSLLSPNFRNGLGLLFFAGRPFQACLAIGANKGTLYPRTLTNFISLMSDKVKIVKTRCPRCRTRVNWEGNPYRPFCSEKCRLIDLGRWADEEYRIAGKQVDTEEEPQE